MWNPIRMAIFGSISDIKTIVVEKSTNAYGKAKDYINKKRSNNQQEIEVPKYENNPDINVLDK